MNEENVYVERCRKVMAKLKKIKDHNDICRDLHDTNRVPYKQAVEYLMQKEWRRIDGWIIINPHYETVYRGYEGIPDDMFKKLENAIKQKDYISATVEIGQMVQGDPRHLNYIMQGELGYALLELFIVNRIKGVGFEQVDSEIRNLFSRIKPKGKISDN
jgi:hypothetical protein